MQIALTGDVMLGRMVDQEVIRNQSLRPEALWGDVLPILLAADLRVINLECVISASGREWHPQSKAFHFRAYPRAIDCLKSASINAVTLANNHVLDYGAEALLDCLGLLDRAGIMHAGAGRNLAAAMEPAFLPVARDVVAVLALTDNEPDWEATDVKPGVVYVAYDHRGLKEPYRARVAGAIKRARRQAGLVLVSAHVGPNWGAPSVEMQALARELLDLGADFYWGHSNHTPQGIELYRGKAILYSSGDFIDDYMVDENERNDLSFLFVLDVEAGRVSHIRLHPVRIEHCRVKIARHQDALFLQKTMFQMAQEGTGRLVGALAGSGLALPEAGEIGQQVCDVLVAQRGVRQHAASRMPLTDRAEAGFVVLQGQPGAIAKIRSSSGQFCDRGCCVRLQ